MKNIVIILLFCFALLYNANAQIAFELKVKNNENYEIEIKIKKGELFEVLEDDVQNIIILEDVTIRLSPRETKSIELEVGVCANEHRASPCSGSQVLVTPIRLNAPAAAFESQEDIWKFLRGR